MATERSIGLAMVHVGNAYNSSFGNHDRGPASVFRPNSNNNLNNKIGSGQPPSMMMMHNSNNPYAQPPPGARIRHGVPGFQQSSFPHGGPNRTPSMQDHPRTSSNSQVSTFQRESTLYNSPVKGSRNTTTSVRSDNNMSSNYAQKDQQMLRHSQQAQGMMPQLDLQTHKSEQERMLLLRRQEEANTRTYDYSRSTQQQQQAQGMQTLDHIQYHNNNNNNNNSGHQQMMRRQSNESSYKVVVQPMNHLQPGSDHHQPMMPHPSNNDSHQQEKSYNHFQASSEHHMMMRRQSNENPKIQGMLFHQQQQAPSPPPPAMMMMYPNPPVNGVRALSPNRNNDVSIQDSSSSSFATAPPSGQTPAEKRQFRSDRKLQNSPMKTKKGPPPTRHGVNRSHSDMELLGKRSTTNTAHNNPLSVVGLQGDRIVVAAASPRPAQSINLTSSSTVSVTHARVPQGYSTGYGGTAAAAPLPVQIMVPTDMAANGKQQQQQQQQMQQQQYSQPMRRVVSDAELYQMAHHHNHQNNNNRVTNVSWNGPQQQQQQQALLGQQQQQQYQILPAQQQQQAPTMPRTHSASVMHPQMVLSNNNDPRRYMAVPPPRHHHRRPLRSCLKGAPLARNARNPNRVQWIRNDVSLTGVAEYMNAIVHIGEIWWTRSELKARVMEDTKDLTSHPVAQTYAQECDVVYQTLRQEIQQLQRHAQPLDALWDQCTLASMLTPGVMAGLKHGYRGMEAQCKPRRVAGTGAVSVRRNQSEESSLMDRLWARAIALADQVNAMF